jgi:hypothetical protein
MGEGVVIARSEKKFSRNKGTVQMPLRRILFVLFAIALFSMYASGRLLGAELYGWVSGRYHGPVPYYICNPKAVEISQPGPGAIAAGAVISNPSLSGGACPSAYPYGYFGAQTRPYSVTHTNYYHDFSQWSFRRGY